MGTSCSNLSHAAFQVASMDDIRNAVRRVQDWEELQKNGKSTKVVQAVRADSFRDAAISLPGDLISRIGGPDAAKHLVMRFYSKLMSEPTIEPFFKDLPAPRLRTYQLRFMQFVLGGPETYAAGPDALHAKHCPIKEKGLTPAHVDTLIKILRETFAERGVAQDVVEKAVAHVERGRRAIFTPKELGKEPVAPPAILSGSPSTSSNLERPLLDSKLSSSTAMHASTSAAAVPLTQSASQNGRGLSTGGSLAGKPLASGMSRSTSQNAGASMPPPPLLSVGSSPRLATPPPPPSVAAATAAVASTSSPSTSRPGSATARISPATMASSDLPAYPPPPVTLPAYPGLPTNLSIQGRKSPMPQSPAGSSGSPMLRPPSATSNLAPPPFALTSSGSGRGGIPPPPPFSPMQRPGSSGSMQGGVLRPASSLRGASPLAPPTASSPMPPTSSSPAPPTASSPLPPPVAASPTPGADMAAVDAALTMMNEEEASTTALGATLLGDDLDAEIQAAADLLGQADDAEDKADE